MTTLGSDRLGGGGGYTAVVTHGVGGTEGSDTMVLKKINK